MRTQRMWQKIKCWFGRHEFETIWDFQNDFWSDWKTGKAKSTIKCKHCGVMKK